MAFPPLVNHRVPSLFNSVVVEPSPTLASTPNSLDSTFTFNTSGPLSNKPVSQWTSVAEPRLIPSSETSGSSSKPVNRWSSSEIRMLIEHVEKQQQALQQVKDPREKEQIWDKIIFIIQSSDIASSALKKCTKASIQQKWDSLL